MRNLLLLFLAAGAIIALYISRAESVAEDRGFGRIGNEFYTYDDLFKLQWDATKRVEVVPEEEEIHDEIGRMDTILVDALEKAKLGLRMKRYRREYKLKSKGLPIVTVKIQTGYLFTNSQKHAIIHRSTPGDVFINIYAIQGSTFLQVIQHEQLHMTYTSDTIQDINGDHRKDFVVNWYGNSGCCLKAFAEVYLRGIDGQFSEPFKFINPTFSPAESVIRGVRYGHPGETEMYKYKWNGETVDTMEYLFLQKDENGKNTGLLIRADKLPYGPVKPTKIEFLKSVPTEYDRIMGIDWFLDKL